MGFDSDSTGGSSSFIGVTQFPGSPEPRQLRAVVEILRKDYSHLKLSLL